MEGLPGHINLLLPCSCLCSLVQKSVAVKKLEKCSFHCMGLQFIHINFVCHSLFRACAIEVTYVWSQFGLTTWQAMGELYCDVQISSKDCVKFITTGYTVLQGDIKSGFSYKITFLYILCLCSVVNKNT